jgi:hypothetical protein
MAAARGSRGRRRIAARPGLRDLCGLAETERAGAGTGAGLDSSPASSRSRKGRSTSGSVESGATAASSSDP